MRFFLVAIMIFASTGCVNITERRVAASAGAIGCSESQIAISEEKDESWAATCKGKKFYCAAAGPTCKEELK